MPPPPPLLPFPIPDSILLLIHLHLLQCPLELDPNMFNSGIRGIGDRIKTMEHIVCFLIGKAEGQQRVKVLLPMYPSKKPADMVAFRNAVIKYLEGLRTRALKPSHPTKQQASNLKLTVRGNRTPNLTGPSHATVKKPALPPKRPLPPARSVSATAPSRSASGLSSVTSKQASTSRSVSVGISKPSTLRSTSQVSTVANETKSSASPKPGVQANTTTICGWWWKDVPVRKSLLEECTGPRFERLLLALSIHVLMLHDARHASSDMSRNDALMGLNSASNLDMFAMLSEQPDDYRNLIRRLSALQLHVSDGEQNLIRQRQAVHALRALIPSNLPTQNDTQPSLQELGSQVVNLTSKLDVSWRPHLNTKQKAEEPSNGEAGGGRNSSMMRWFFALAGASERLEEGNPLLIGQDVGETHPIESRGVRKSAAASRKTILPAPPLPTVAAHHVSHVEVLRVAKGKVSNLRAIHDSRFGENGPSEDTRQLKNADEIELQGSNSIIYDSLLGEETEFSDSLKRFVHEMAELEDRVEKELEIKQKLLLNAYKEDAQGFTGEDVANHPESPWHSELRQPSEGFRLNFETSSDASLPSVLSQRSQIRHHSEVANSIQRAIRTALGEIQANLTAGQQCEWEDEVLLQDLGDALESEDEDTANPPATEPPSGILKPPAKHTQIPAISHTPKRNVFVIQSRSTIKRPGLQKDAQLRSDDLYATLKHAQRPSTPPTKAKHVVQRTPTNLTFSQTPSRQTRQKAQTTPSRAMETPSFFYSPGDGMEDLKEILPPFQSPWRSVARSKKSQRKSGRMSIHRPRLSKGRLGSSSSFVRTPLKSGKRLSSIVPPVGFPFAKLGQATPRASLDDVYEELVSDLVKSSNKRTPPLSMSARRLLDPKNNIQRSSPFKSLAGSGRAPRSPQSPDIGTDIVEDEGQEVEVSFGTTRPLFSNHVDGWEDVSDGSDSASTVRRHIFSTKAKALNVISPRFSEEPSFTLRDMLLKVGQDGMLGVNGTFNFDLLQESQIDVGNDSLFGGI